MNFIIYLQTQSNKPSVNDKFYPEIYFSETNENTIIPKLNF